MALRTRARLFKTFAFLVSMAGIACHRDQGSLPQGAAAADSGDPCGAHAVTARCHDGMCLVPAGCFIMGSPLDEPERGRSNEDQHQVTLTHAFLMGQHELTQSEWTAQGLANRAGTTDNGAGGKDCVADDCPASTMTWYEAVNYLNARSRKEGLQECITLTGCTGTVGTDFTCASYQQAMPSYYECTGYRFPTSAEFQYAIRAGTTTMFYSGSFQPKATGCVDVANLDPTAWYCTNAGNRTHPVGQKTPNPWGLYDMMGNAAELVASEIGPSGTAPVTDPSSTLNSDGSFEALGGFYFSNPEDLRSAAELDYVITGVPYGAARSPGLGFRIVRTLSPSQAAAW